MTPTTSFDFFNLPEIPTFILCNPNREKLFALGGISDRKYCAKFNAMSELTFRADEYVDEILMEYYDYLVHRRLVYVPELGYFMISDVNEKGDGITKYKEITCKSLEVEFENRKVSLFKGQYSFWNSISSGSPTLVETIESYMPGWTIQVDEPTLDRNYKSFDVSDTTLYNFMMTAVEEAYRCIFTYDTINKIVHVSTVPNATTETNIYISYDNLIKTIDIKEVTDNLVTALSVYGGNELSINIVNPMGTPTIYNFEYFKNTNWMSGSLITALNNWEASASALQPIYAGSATDLKYANRALTESSGSLSRLTEEMEALIVEQGALIEQGADLSDVNSRINAKQVLIDAQKLDVQNKTTSRDAIYNLMKIANEEIALDNIANFTLPQQEELQPFIIESSYINENFANHDIFTPEETQDEAQALFDQAKDVLSSISEPRYTFEIDSVNFLMIKEFQTFIDELVLGAIINLEIKEGVVTYPVLLGFELNYDNPTEFKLQFGNRLRFDDEALQFSDLIGQALSSGTTSKVNSLMWSSWTDNYKNDVTSFIDGALNAALNNVISGSSQNIIIDQAGLRGRKINASGSGFLPEQIWMVNNMIAFTDNGWTTAKMAIGEFSGSTLPNGGSAWGIVADYLVGRMLIGNNLLIQNDSNTFEVTQLGATLTNAVLTVDNSVNTIRLDPTNGINIWSKPLSKTVFSVDGNGNAIFSGTLEAAIINASTINGGTINASIINGGTINGTTGNFSGNIYASNLIGLVTMEQLQDIIASKVTSGKMSPDRIDGMSVLGATIAFDRTCTFPNISVNGDINMLGNLVATQTWVLDKAYASATYVNNTVNSEFTSRQDSITVRNATNTGTVTIHYIGW